ARWPALALLAQELVTRSGSGFQASYLSDRKREALRPSWTFFLRRPRALPPARAKAWSRWELRRRAGHWQAAPPGPATGPADQPPADPPAASDAPEPSPGSPGHDCWSACASWRSPARPGLRESCRASYPWRAA